MCGLFGIFGTGIVHVDKEVFHQGLLVTALRGMHSTGIGIAGKTKDGFAYGFHKQPYPSQAVIFDDEYRDFAKVYIDPQVMMGHCRFATQGLINQENAHPFIHRPIMMAHNGSIMNKEHVANKRVFQVDSEAICYGIAVNGLQETINRINGAYTLTFWNGEENSFNIIRNDKRPLHWAKHKHRKVWYYASEPEQLLWILRRNNVEFLAVEELAPDMHLKWSKDDKGTDSVTITKMAPVREWSKSDEDYYGQWEGFPGVGGGFPYSHRRPRGEPRVHDNRDSTNNNRSTTARVKMSDIKGSGISYLAKYGLKAGDSVDAYMCEAVTYTGRPHLATASGWCTGKNVPDACVRSYNFDFLKYSIENPQTTEREIDHGEYRGKITNCFFDQKENTFVIVLSEMRPKLESEAPIVYVGQEDEVATTEVSLPSEQSKSTVEKKDEKGQEAGTEVQKEAQIKLNGPNGSRISIKKFDEMTEAGCHLCEVNIFRKDHTSVLWIKLRGGRDKPVCPVCASRVSNPDTSRRVSIIGLERSADDDSLAKNIIH